MKRKRLYIQIFFTFIFLLIISEILIFIVFRDLFESETDLENNHKLKKYFNETVYLFKGVVQEKINLRPGLPVNQNLQLRKTIENISNKYDLNIWIEVNGKGLVKFSSMDIPEINENDLINSGDYFYHLDIHNIINKGSIYIKIPLQLPSGNNGFIYVYRSVDAGFIRMPFILGLALVGICIALMLYPFSRVITQPLKKLAISANKIAGGDLSQRVNIQGSDEIGQLAISFNRMAATVEGMIKGTKELTANISHELRSPLARMRVAEEMLAEKLGSNNHDSGKYLKYIENEIQTMDSLLGQVLHLTKLDIRKEEKKEDIDVIAVLKDIIEKYNAIFEKKSISVYFKKTEESLIINACKEDIKTVFTNIIDNAAKYTSEDGRITVKIDRLDKGIAALITNTCVRLSDDELLNVFRPFYRASADDTITGSGLGLAITKKIVENHGGSISLENISDGLAVNIALPFC